MPQRFQSGEFEPFAKGFAGTLLQPSDDGYEETRRIHNGLIDKRPRLIAGCRGVQDVVDALAFAREQSLEISVRGGGHNVAGRSVTDGGLMIDLSAMKGIFVDPAGRTVRAQAGVTWGEFNRETQLHGLATTGGIVSTTGVAGLTLGGGLGYLMGAHGLAVDNLISAEIVTADGRVLAASEREHEDLFWGIRGGGGNFGVVTSFEFRLHPVGPLVYGGLIAYPFPAARDVLRFYRDFSADVADELTVYAALEYAPDGSGDKLAGIIACHIGPQEQAVRDLAPLMDFGEPAMVEVGPIPYTIMNSVLDEAYPKGALTYLKSSFLSELSDDAIDAMIETFASCPPSMTAMALEHVHGAATRVPVTATAFPHRDPAYSLLISGEWMDPTATDDIVAWTRTAYETLRSYGAGGRYVGYLDDDDEGPDPIREAYGPVYDRLVEVKNKYDSENTFHLNHNIIPSVRR